MATEVNRTNVPTSHCLKCKIHTPNIKIQVVKLKNGAFAEKSTCGKCGSSKFKFIKNPSAMKGGNPLAAVGAVAEALPGLVSGIGEAVDQGRRTTHEISKENGALQVDQAYNIGEREKKFQQFYRDLMHKRFWDGESLPPRLRFPRYKTNNPAYAAEQEAADDKLYAYAEKVYGRA